MSVTILADKWADYRKGPGKKTRGHERKGYQASNLLSAMTVMTEKQGQAPRVERARIAVESVRVVGPDDLTARDEAAYQFLLSYARAQRFDRETHRVDVRLLQDYLDTHSYFGRKPSVDRVVECLDRLARTTVRYSFLDEQEGARRRATLPLIIAETVERLKDGSAFVEFGIPFALRRVMLEATDYVMLDINVFPHFRCRYSPRLYQRLAIIARTDPRVRSPWSLSPQELAEALGWTSKAEFHVGAFMRDCVAPAVAEINLYSGMSVKLTKVLGKGRGSPVEQVVLEVEGTAVPHLAQVKAAPLTSAQVHALAQAEDADMPSASAVARAVTLTRMPPEELSSRWIDVLRRTKSLQPRRIMVDSSDPEAVEAAMVRDGIEDDGVDHAFWRWAGRQGRVPDPVADMNADRPASVTETVLEERPGYRKTVVQAQVAAPRTPAPEPVRVPPAPPVFRRPLSGTPAAPLPAFDPAASGKVLETSDDIPF